MASNAYGISKDFNGVVFIKKNQEILLKRGFGFRMLPDEIPNEVDTKFASASASKVFVAMGILQLIEKGLIKLDTSLGEVLPRDWKKIDSGLTIQQLLTHTSGIPDYFDESEMDSVAELFENRPSYNFRTPMDMVPLFLDKEMMYRPGERFQYNNTAFVVLALIIEEVAKMPFDAYLKKRYFNQPV
jgi:CubicO group peptidase (beta-lactamase class C family)